MKRFLFVLSYAFSILSVVAAETPSVFQGVAGLQLYSLRDAFTADVSGTLDKVKAWGITEVETYSLHGMTAEKFRDALTSRGLKPVSGHFQYEALSKDIASVGRDAKALGLAYVACPWIPHEPAQFTEEVARKAAADFNRWGEALAKEGLKFAYHPHGYEFAPHANGTLFDVLASDTKPQFVSFEMDVFWVIHPGQDPVKLLEKYSGRWTLMHLKDIRKGARTGIYTGRAPHTDNVPIGNGQVDWPAVLRAAGRVGIKHYFIEDEAQNAGEQIPQSLRYLNSLR